MEKKGFIAEFKEFIARGNVMDLAVGVIIGGAFSTITNSLINDLIMPLLGILTNSISFADLAVNIGPAVITYGNFIQAVLNFLVMALVVFWLVKAVNKVTALGKKEEEAPAEPEAPPRADHGRTAGRHFRGTEKGLKKDRPSGGLFLYSASGVGVGVGAT